MPEAGSVTLLESRARGTRVAMPPPFWIVIGPMLAGLARKSKTVMMPLPGGAAPTVVEVAELIAPLLPIKTTPLPMVNVLKLLVPAEGWRNRLL